MPKILGSGIAESKGLRHGYIINSSDVTQSILAAMAQAEKAAGVKARRVFLSVGGIGLGSIVSHGSAIITRADSEITDLDLKKVMETSESEIPPSLSLNRKILHTIPLQYKIDGKPVFGRPMGMKGNKLEVKTLFITCLEHHLNDLIQAVEDADLEVVDVMAAPIAASFVTLTKTQKIAGCVLANIGAETLSIVVHENSIPISLEVFPIGSNDVTNDIALGLKIPLEEAERIKLGGVPSMPFPKKKLDDIVAARLSDMFELIDNHLKKIGRNGLLPAGIILTGGGSGIGSIDEFAKSSLKLPSRLGSLQLPAGTKVSVQDSTWSVAYGLCIFGMTSDDSSISGHGRIWERMIRAVRKWVKQFLP